MSFSSSRLVILGASVEGEIVVHTNWISGKLISVVVCMRLVLMSIAFRFESIVNKLGSRSVEIGESSMVQV